MSSFEVNSVTYREFGASYSTSLIFSDTQKISDFTINGLLPSDFQASHYWDSDGDNPSSSTPLTVGTLSYTWVDNNSTPIPSADYNKKFLQLKASGYIFPLTLTIVNQDVQVHSEYGDPLSSQKVTITKQYIINNEQGFYAVKPRSTGRSCQWVEKTNGMGSDADGWVCASQTTDRQNGHSDPYGGGYSSDYIPDVGFKASPSADPFPTVGFKGAEFQLIMTGNQTDYSFSSPDLSVNVNSLTGDVELKSKPSGPVSIFATHTSSGTIYIYSFTIKKWYEPQSGSDVNYSDALTKCGSVSNMISRADFTNSPISTIPVLTNWSYVRNYGKRAIDGTIYGEWGYLNNTTYPNSNWQNGMY